MTNPHLSREKLVLNWGELSLLLGPWGVHRGNTYQRVKEKQGDRVECFKNK